MSSWLNFLIPFVGGAVKGFVEEYQKPSPHRQSGSVVAFGGCCGFQWAVVPHAQASAFHASYPDACTIEIFHAILKKWAKTKPGYVIHIEPFVNELNEAIDRYHGTHQIFVATAG